MKRKQLNRNKISNINFSVSKRYILSKNKYLYNFINKLSNKTIDLKDYKSIVIMILKSGKKSYLQSEKKKFQLKNNKIIIIDNIRSDLILDNTKNTILIAATKQNKNKSKKINQFDIDKSYKVLKHWGYELWINGRSKNFAFKKIFLKKGNKTSLQYHNRKKETNFLFDGKIYLHYLAKNKNFSDIDLNKDIKKRFIKSPSIIDVNPKTIHRIEAITDLILFETSTPHLDDVIRLQDDKSRKSGLIKSEHSSIRT